MLLPSFRQERLQFPFFQVPKSPCQVFVLFFWQKNHPGRRDDTPAALVSISIISLRNAAIREDKLVTIRRQRNWLSLPVTGNTAFPSIVSSCRQRCRLHWMWVLRAQTRYVSSNTSAGRIWKRGGGCGDNVTERVGTRYTVSSKRHPSVYPPSNVILKNWNSFTSL